jgi:hypothetical protein
LAGTADQFDDCTVGNVCLVPDPGSGLSFCFAICRSALDCAGGVACSDRLLSKSGAKEVLVKVCDPPYRSCSPSSPQPCCDPVGPDFSGCPDGQFCYLVPFDPGSRDNRTVCDYTTGGGGRASPCTSSRDCMQGWTCVGAEAGAPGLCRQVCDPQSINPCGLSGEVCSDYGNQYGVCLG